MPPILIPSYGLFLPPFPPLSHTPLPVVSRPCADRSLMCQSLGRPRMQVAPQRVSVDTVALQGTTARAA